MKKRVVSLLMALCMLIAMLPAMSMPARAEAVDLHAGRTADSTLYRGIVGNVLHISSKSTTQTPNSMSTSATNPG